MVPVEQPARPPAPEPDDPIVPSSSVAAQCAAPRAGIDPATGRPFTDMQGSLETEKAWLRAWIDETYLWYDEVPTSLRARDYANPVTWFSVLKTPKLTASGRPKDRFHFTADTATAQKLARDGSDIGYGMYLAFISATPPRDLRVAFVEPGSPADQAKVVRGDRLVAIDGIDVGSTMAVDALNRALAPAPGDHHAFRLRATDGTERSVDLTSTTFQRQPVLSAGVFGAGQRRIGYMLFNSHAPMAEYGLSWVIGEMRRINTTDLVIDMRYNGGGYLNIASQLAFMVSSSDATDGKVFEELRFNDKIKATPEQARIPFHGKTLGYEGPPGEPLPQLGLSTVTVLTGPDTCSASESLINGLRGVGVKVNVVGGTTCGKPYGFIPRDNCGTTYYAVQFHGVNHQGFGDYADGIVPTCAVPDDFTHALGDRNEGRLAAAFSLIENGVCPAPAVAGKTEVGLLKAEADRIPYLVRSPLHENRWLDRP